MRVLVGCEFSGIVRDAFIAKGHDAWSCDIIETEKGAGPHYRCDVRFVLDHGWDLAIFHPPCTFLANSGVRWLYKKGPQGPTRDMQRWKEMRLAAEFFESLLNAPIPRIGVENPIMHRHAKAIINMEPSQIIQPWQFGQGETKATCLWLKNLPLLVPTSADAPLFGGKAEAGRVARVHLEPPGPDRQKNRSRTYQGIAEAMAEQWGNL